MKHSKATTTHTIVWTYFGRASALATDSLLDARKLAIALRHSGAERVNISAV
jgi:hypothetical protein